MRKSECGSVCIIRDHKPDQHRTFFSQLPFLVVADDVLICCEALAESHDGETNVIQLAL